VPAEIELDRDDERAIHLLATSAGRPVGTARVVMSRRAKIGAWAVLIRFRRKAWDKIIDASCCDGQEIARASDLSARQVPVMAFMKPWVFAASVGFLTNPAFLIEK